MGDFQKYWSQNVGQDFLFIVTSYFDQTCNEFILDWVIMACLGPKPIKVLFKD
jgi:hypothetical protein